MRVVNEVNSMFHEPDFIRRANFLSAVKGGWERWFQLELAYYIASRYVGQYDVSLEDKTVYPKTALRADLVLKSRFVDNTTTVVELKCQVGTADTEDYYDLIEEDIKKIGALASGNDYQVIALVRDREDLEPLYHALATQHPDQVFKYPFPSTLSSPSGFISFYQGAGSLDQ